MTDTERNMIINILLEAHEQQTTCCGDCVLRRCFGVRTPESCCAACEYTQNGKDCTKQADA